MMNRNYLKTVRELVFLFILISFFGIFSIGQTSKTDEQLEVIVPEQAMKQVVSRVLTWYFKPRNKPTIIFIAERGIQKEWLPEIKNIEFRLLSDETINESGKEILFFTEPKLILLCQVQI